MKHVTKILETFFKTVIVLMGIIAAVIIIYMTLDVLETLWLVKMLKHSLLFLLT